MKARPFFFTFLAFLLLFSACKKDRHSNEVYGIVTEFGTNKPLAGVTVSFRRCVDVSSDCEPSVFTETDASGHYRLSFPNDEGGILRAGPETPPGYFSVNPAPVSLVGENEKNFVLDPHAYLHLRVKNVAPAEEFDGIRLGAYLGPVGGGSSGSEYLGANVDITHTRKLRGNRELPTGWGIFYQEILQEFMEDTLFISAHDTLYYEINY